MSTDIREACQALISGYDAGKSMLDDDMIGHAETIAGQPEVIRALLDARKELEFLRELVRDARMFVQPVADSPEATDHVEAIAWCESARGALVGRV